jgi:simple sugar transport system permease protein
LELEEKDKKMSLPMSLPDSHTLIEMTRSTLRGATPLLFAALGGFVCERSGVINIALEGLMLMGAFAAASAAYATGNPWIGMAAGMMAGVIFAAIYAFSVIPLRSNQIVAGTAINLLAAGSSPFLCKVFFGSGRSTPSVEMGARFQSAPMWIALALVGVASLWARYTPSGLWVRFAGENPEALAAAGVRVNRVRWFAVLTSGALSGLGGASLSIFLASSFSQNMTAGRGFMALAALIFGKWRPIPAALACLLFGLTDAMQIRLQGVVLWGSEAVPVQFIQILPYVVTVLVLAGFVGQSRAPKSLGLPYSQG